MKKIKTIVTALLLLITLYIPLSCTRQSKDFEMNGKVLIKYNGSATNVTIPKGVTAIINRNDPFTGVFSGCSNLTSVTIPPSVTYIENWEFSKCESLTSITVDSKNPAYSSVDGVLFNKEKTDLITYPPGKQESTYTIPLSVTSIRHGAFARCSSLVNITIPSSVTSIGAFTMYSSLVNFGYLELGRCSSLTIITVDGQNPAYSSVDGVLFNKDITNLVNYPPGKQESTYTIPLGVTSIGEGAFNGCSNLASITIPSSLTSIGHWAFEGCESLTSIYYTDYKQVLNIFLNNSLGNAM